MSLHAPLDSYMTEIGIGRAAPPPSLLVVMCRAKETKSLAQAKRDRRFPWWQRKLTNLRRGEGDRKMRKFGRAATGIIGI